MATIEPFFRSAFSDPHFREEFEADMKKWSDDNEDRGKLFSQPAVFVARYDWTWEGFLEGHGDVSLTYDVQVHRTIETEHEIYVIQRQDRPDGSRCLVATRSKDTPDTVVLQSLAFHGACASPPLQQGHTRVLLHVLLNMLYYRVPDVMEVQLSDKARTVDGAHRLSTLSILKHGGHTWYGYYFGFRPIDPAYNALYRENVVRHTQLQLMDGKDIWQILEDAGVLARPLSDDQRRSRQAGLALLRGLSRYWWKLVKEGVGDEAFLGALGMHVMDNRPYHLRLRD